MNISYQLMKNDIVDYNDQYILLIDFIEKRFLDNIEFKDHPDYLSMIDVHKLKKLVVPRLIAEDDLFIGFIRDLLLIINENIST